ncbi:DUF3306 domain-containing protein [Shimia sp. MMG029]|uniref:DUF3306 domain-containing protein n=1 Tax=Shimia sp. MMG029 TaxID=3021978 RepID=UPI0022FDFB3A|nr:DUF3306 domain-containing protein [Shimia sp. MMG029]MDA5557504.1 DUF3306 domain-containing protein [Shimia sp. MMG029]
MSRGGDFWARRKAAVAEEAAEAALVAEQQVLAQEHAVLEEKADAEILAELELPDPDALKQGDDFTVFLAKAVPERIRRRALRKLWLTNPVLANLDELVDYGEDFTDSAMVIEGMQTAYQVGKGMLKHVEELARQAAEKEAAEAGSLVEAEAADDAVEDVTEVSPAEMEEMRDGGLEGAPVAMAFEGEDAEIASGVAEAAEPEPVAPVRRRLRFEFAGIEQTEGMTQE